MPGVTRSQIRVWMRRHYRAYIDECGDVNSTQLGEGCAQDLDAWDQLDQENSDIWEVASEVANSFNRLIHDQVEA